MGGGAVAYATKRSVVSLVASSLISAMYGVSFYLTLAYKNTVIGFCIAATASLCALGIGVYQLFFDRSEETRKKHVATAVYSAGLASTFFYHGVLFTKVALGQTPKA